MEQYHTGTKTNTQMRTIETKVYTFDELSEEAQEKAISECRYINTTGWDGWWESTYEDAADVGIKITGFDTGRGNDIDGEVKDTEETAHAIIKNHGKQCETYKTATAYLQERDELVNTWAKDEAGDFKDEYLFDEKMNDLGEDFTKSILEDYLQILRDEVEYLESDEAVKESIEANGYEFTEEGERA